MIIELTDKKRHNVAIITSNIDFICNGKNGTCVYLNSAGNPLIVTETPTEIQELIMLDEFAGLAMSGLLANSHDDFSYMSTDATAKQSYKLAKAMIEARREAVK